MIMDPIKHLKMKYNIHFWTMQEKMLTLRGLESMKG